MTTDGDTPKPDEVVPIPVILAGAGDSGGVKASGPGWCF
jgi:hypothetical protein